MRNWIEATIDLTVIGAFCIMILTLAAVLKVGI